MTIALLKVTIERHHAAIYAGLFADQSIQLYKKRRGLPRLCLSGANRNLLAHQNHVV
jgi:hypothetical protein